MNGSGMNGAASIVIPITEREGLEVQVNTYKGHIKNVLVSAAPTDPAVPLYDVPAGDYTPGNYLRAVAGATGLTPVTVGTLNAIAQEFDAQTAIEADAEEKGNGYTPILGAHISIGDRINIGLKYEFSKTLSASAGYFFEIDDPSNVKEDAILSPLDVAILDLAGPAAQMSWDTRDDVLLPKKGNHTFLAVNTALEPLGSETELFEIQAQSIYQVPLRGQNPNDFGR